MRLGASSKELFDARTPEDLDRLAETCDVYGLSAVTGPWGYDEMSEDEVAAYGERAEKLGLVIGESHARSNLLIRDIEERGRRIERLREGLRLAEIMGSRSVCILVGTAGPEDRLAAPHPFNYTTEARDQFRETVLRVMDGLDLQKTSLLIEPWTNTFFYQPEDIRSFLDSVDHPRVGVHLDLMNMVDQYHYYRTTELIDRTFDLLAGYIGAIHFKDLRWDWNHMYLKFDEVPVGEGVIDYRTYLQRVAALGRDTACFAEHFRTVGDFAISFAKLHRLAAEIGVPFLPRNAQTA
ncbi:MAG: sugar phosphate isomerase/epimerase [Clostridiales Family XIII bacterium]|jgi:sugar phosphate isomerase/epimerase|nr:sugar phosphate isomerase/epimerase [Clostridiales Family XIII bacterium]